MTGIKFPYQANGLLPLLVLAASIGLCAPSLAEDADPFQMSKDSWMSYEHYIDNAQRNSRPVGNEAASEKPSEAQPPSADTARADEKPTSQPPVTSTHAVAAPTRPLSLPALPGVSKGLGIAVDSTADAENASATAQIVTKNDGKSDLHLQEENWQDAAEIARKRAEEKNNANNENAHMPLAVRMSFLPNPKVAPLPSPERKTRPRLAEIPGTTQAPPADPPKAQLSPAECAAVDLYKKKQLEALQSDRQTLKALQSAITDLGLQKQLDFMAGSHQSSVTATLPKSQQSSAPTGNP